MLSYHPLAVHHGQAVQILQVSVDLGVVKSKYGSIDFFKAFHEVPHIRQE